MKKSILVTGCAGFIGGNFVQQFKKRLPNITIVGIDDFSTSTRETLPDGLTFYEGSITDAALLDTVFKKHRPEYIFHFAARPRVSFSVQNPTLTTDINIRGTVTLLEKARDYKTKRFILSSSSSVYGGAKKLPTKEHENTPNPRSPYALQKYVDELFCQMFSNLYGLDTVCLRYFNVFGPGQYGNSAYSTVVCAWLEGLYFPKNKDLFIEGNGTQSRDFSYIDNVVQANIKAMQCKKPVGGEVFNIGNGERTSLKRVKKLIEKYTGKTLRLKVKPTRVGDVRHTHADISKAKKWFGYSPTVTFEKGLQDTIRWFEQRKK